MRVRSCRTSGSLRNRLRSSLHDIDFILTNQAQFKSPNIPLLNKNANALKDLMLQVTRAASRCIGKPADARFPELRHPRHG